MPVKYIKMDKDGKGRQRRKVVGDGRPRIETRIRGKWSPVGGVLGGGGTKTASGGGYFTSLAGGGKTKNSKRSGCGSS